MKKLFLFVLFAITISVTYSQNFKDVLVKTDIFEVMYSQKYEQPLWVKYTVKCLDGKASRAGMDFYTNDSIHTSDHDDYAKNIYDKGHMAPAADFNCTREMLYKTFSYLNCALQHQDLNRTTWRLLEVKERLLANENKIVEVTIICVFSKNSIKLSTGATVPDGFYKTIKYGKTVEKYYFKNDKPSSLDYSKYLIK